MEELGLKNTRVGNARVSEVHGNFFVNDGGATATEMLELIDKMKNGGANGAWHRVGNGSANRGGERLMGLPKKVAVLMGGPGSEREVSLATGKGVSRRRLRSSGSR